MSLDNKLPSPLENNNLQNFINGGSPPTGGEEKVAFGKTLYATFSAIKADVKEKINPKLEKIDKAAKKTLGYLEEAYNNIAARVIGLIGRVSPSIERGLRIAPDREKQEEIERQLSSINEQIEALDHLPDGPELLEMLGANEYAKFMKHLEEKNNPIALVKGKVNQESLGPEEYSKFIKHLKSQEKIDTKDEEITAGENLSASEYFKFNKNKNDYLRSEYIKFKSCSVKSEYIEYKLISLNNEIDKDKSSFKSSNLIYASFFAKIELTQKKIEKLCQGRQEIIKPPLTKSLSELQVSIQENLDKLTLKEGSLKVGDKALLIKTTAQIKDDLVKLAELKGQAAQANNQDLADKIQRSFELFSDDPRLKIDHPETIQAEITKINSQLRGKDSTEQDKARLKEQKSLYQNMLVLRALTLSSSPPFIEDKDNLNKKLLESGTALKAVEKEIQDKESPLFKQAASLITALKNQKNSPTHSQADIKDIENAIKMIENEVLFSKEAEALKTQPSETTPSVDPQQTVASYQNLWNKLTKLPIDAEFQKNFLFSYRSFMKEKCFSNLTFSDDSAISEDSAISAAAKSFDSFTEQFPNASPEEKNQIMAAAKGWASNPQNREEYYKNKTVRTSIDEFIQAAKDEKSPLFAEFKNLLEPHPSRRLFDLFTAEFASASIEGKREILRMAGMWANDPAIRGDDHQIAEVKTAIDQFLTTVKKTPSLLIRDLTVEFEKSLEAKQIKSEPPVPQKNAMTASQLVSNVGSGALKSGSDEYERAVKDFAADLTTKAAHAFKQIKSSDFANLAWNTSPNITEATNQFNDLSHFVEEEVLKQDSPEKRAQVISFFIHVHQRLLHNEEAIDFNSAMAIAAGLGKASINRLTATWKCVDTKLRDKLGETDKLRDSNYKGLRDAIATASVPSIPFLGMYLTDLVFTCEGNHTFITHGLDKGTGKRVDITPELNTEKVGLFGSNVDKCISLQRNVNYDPEKKLSYDLSSLSKPNYNEGTTYTESLKLEPRAKLENASEWVQILKSAKTEYDQQKTTNKSQAAKKYLETVNPYKQSWDKIKGDLKKSEYFKDLKAQFKEYKKISKHGHYIDDPAKRLEAAKRELQSNKMNIGKETENLKNANEDIIAFQDSVIQQKNGEPLTPAEKIKQDNLNLALYKATLNISHFSKSFLDIYDGMTPEQRSKLDIVPSTVEAYRINAQQLEQNKENYTIAVDSFRTECQRLNLMEATYLKPLPSTSQLGQAIEELKRTEESYFTALKKIHILCSHYVEQIDLFSSETSKLYIQDSKKRGQVVESLNKLKGCSPGLIKTSNALIENFKSLENSFKSAKTGVEQLENIVAYTKAAKEIMDENNYTTLLLEWNEAYAKLVASADLAPFDTYQVEQKLLPPSETDSLGSFLIQPTQRPFRYNLLVDEIKKNASKELSEIAGFLVPDDFSKAISNMLHEINDVSKLSIRQIKEQLQNLRPGEKLRFSGDLSSPESLKSVERATPKVFRKLAKGGESPESVDALLKILNALKTCKDEEIGDATDALNILRTHAWAKQGLKKNKNVVEALIKEVEERLGVKEKTK